MPIAMYHHPPALILNRSISMNIYCIYKVTNKTNNKSYIGFTSNFKKRKTNHISNSKNTKTPFAHALKKYPESKFDWTILYMSKDKDHCLKEMEQYFITEYNTMLPYGYNKCPGGGGGTVSEKQRQRMIYDNPMTKLRINSGSWGIRPPIPDSPETREKKRLSKLGKLNPNYGKPETGLHFNKLAKCTKCGLESNVGNITRWHNEKCKK